jgi:hypothetical protein
MKHKNYKIITVKFLIFLIILNQNKIKRILHTCLHIVMGASHMEWSAGFTQSGLETRAGLWYKGQNTILGQVDEAGPIYLLSRG